MRLIDADALIDKSIELYCKDCDRRKGIKNGKWRIVYEIGDAPCRACGIADMQDYIEVAPTIEPKRGKWVDHIMDCWCSVCGGRVEKERAKMLLICPYCGERMERSEE